MPATIFSGTKVKALKKILNLNGGSDVQSSTVDPTSVATDGLPGSLLLNETTGFVYRKLDSGSSTNWEKLPSAGQTGINYILNADAEVNTNGWATYADAAGSVPVDGTGGSPTVTWTRSTSSPLRGQASFLLTKDAANRQGEGASYSFTIDSADKNKLLNISCDFAVASGTYIGGESSDLRVFIYDVTNTQLITPFGIYLSVASGKFQTQFLSSSSSSYRLIIHVATTSSSAYTVKFDNFNVGPQDVSYGAVIGDFVSYTPTFTGFGTVSNINFKYRQVGSNIELQGYFTAGTPTAVEAEITLPSGMSIQSSVTTDQVFGSLVTNGVQTGAFYVLGAPSASLLNVSFTNNTGGGITPANGDEVVSASQNVSVCATIPIQGLSSQLVTQNALTYSISNYLANGTQVTGGPPTKLGEYRSMIRSGSSVTTGSDSTPTDLPNSSNGIRIYASAYNTAGTSGQIQRYEIFVGKSKNILWQFYANTGKTGYLNVDARHSGGAAVERVKGAELSYDPSTGIAAIDTLWTNDGNDTTHELGDTFSGAGANTAVSDGYFDIIVSQGVIPVQVTTPRSEIYLTSGNGYGSTNTKIRRYSTVVKNVGPAITYADSATDGSSFTINEDGIYSVDVMDISAGGQQYGISKNSSQLTTNLGSINNADRIIVALTGAAGEQSAISSTLFLQVGDVIRPHSEGSLTGAADNDSSFRITKVSN